MATEDPHQVAAHRARLAAEALSEAERAEPQDRLYLRAAAALQATAAYFAEAAENPQLKSALLEATQSGISETAVPGEEDRFSRLPASQRGLTMAFQALKAEAARDHVDLSSVVRASIVEA